MLEVLEDRQGGLWFASGDGVGSGEGVSRYDNEGFVTFANKDVLPGGKVRFIPEQPYAQ